MRPLHHRPPAARAIALLATAFGLLAAGAGPKPKPKVPPPLPALNEKVLDFARERFGQKVGDGQCTALAIEALRAAGARHLPRNRAEGDYVWGREVASFKDARPGDVLQFRDAVFEGRRYVTRFKWVSWHHTYPHHTAILADVREGGRVIDVLHQNIGADDAPPSEREVVKKTELRPASLKKGGRVWIYRPVSPEDPEPETP